VFVVDTNILVAAASRDAPDHPKARAALQSWLLGEEPFYATWPILYEFLRVSTHRAVWPRAATISEAAEFLKRLFGSSSFGLLLETERHASLLLELARDYPALSGSVLHDFHTAVLMKEHGVTEIRTADTDFHQFRFLRVVNPLA
jgi:hypothetical protein